MTNTWHLPAPGSDHFPSSSSPVAMTRPIGPTPEQLTEWLRMALEAHPDGKPALIGGYMAGRAWNAGTDAELEACDQLMKQSGWEGLAAARRPATPSPREQALAALERISGWLDTADVACIRQALQDDD